MKPNSNILTSVEHLLQIKRRVESVADLPQKEDILSDIEMALAGVMAANTDIDNANSRIVELTKQIYEPIVHAQLTYPAEGDYNAVREYIEQRKQRDPIFLKYFKTHTRAQLCIRLTDEFGWVVDSHSLMVNMSRH